MFYAVSLIPPTLAWIDKPVILIRSTSKYWVYTQLKTPEKVRPDYTIQSPNLEGYCKSSVNPGPLMSYKLKLISASSQTLGKLARNSRNTQNSSTVLLSGITVHNIGYICNNKLFSWCLVQIRHKSFYYVPFFPLDILPCMKNCKEKSANIIYKQIMWWWWWWWWLGCDFTRKKSI